MVGTLEACHSPAAVHQEVEALLTEEALLAEADLRVVVGRPTVECLLLASAQRLARQVARQGARLELLEAACRLVHLAKRHLVRPASSHPAKAHLLGRLAVVRPSVAPQPAAALLVSWLSPVVALMRLKV